MLRTTINYCITWNKGPRHIHGLRSCCFTKKSAFNIPGNLVIVVKFMFQIVFGNSRQNPRHTSKRGGDESLELHYNYSLIWLANIKTKGFTSWKSFCHSCSQIYVIFQRERSHNWKYVCCSRVTSKGELMPKDSLFLFFFWLRVHVISLNLIAFILSIETEASLLALAKSIYCLCNKTKPNQQFYFPNAFHMMLV